MKVHFFGTGSAIPNRERCRSSLAIEAADGTFLLPDCGEMVSTGIIRLGVVPDDVRAVIVTHLHPDHIAGLPLVLQHFQLRGRTKALNVFLPAEGIEAVREFLRTVYLGSAMLKFKINFCPIQPDKTVVADNFSMTFFANKHLAMHAQTRRLAGETVAGESYSVLISDDRKKLLYSGDIASVEELQTFLMPGIDALILEYAHISAEEAVAFAAEPDIPRQVILTHFHPRCPVDMLPPVSGWICAFDGMDFTF